MEWVYSYNPGAHTGLNNGSNSADLYNGVMPPFIIFAVFNVSALPYLRPYLTFRVDSV